MYMLCINGMGLFVLLTFGYNQILNILFPPTSLSFSLSFSFFHALSFLSVTDAHIHTLFASCWKSDEA